MIDNAARFDEDMYNWDITEIQEYIDKKSTNNFVYIEFSYKQLGRDDEWFRQNCRDLGNNLLKIRREILLEWTRASDVSVYSEEQLAEIEKYIKQPVSNLVINKFWKLYFYTEDFDFFKPYVVSCDVATGTDKDASAITIFDPLSLKIIAEFRENHIDTEDFKKVIYEIISKYFMNSMLVIENNSVGIAILQSLMKTSIARNIYYEYKEVKGQKIERSMTQNVYTSTKTKTQKYGVTTDKASRPLMLEILENMVNESPELIATPNLYSDIKGLEYNKNGKIEHGPTQHDDSLFSYLVGRFALLYGTNLSRFMMPINGKSTKQRKQSLSRMNKALSESNRLSNRPSPTIGGLYNGIANDMVEENAFMKLRSDIDKGGYYGKYLGLSKTEEIDKFDSFQKYGRDMF